MRVDKGEISLRHLGHQEQAFALEGDARFLFHAHQGEGIAHPMGVVRGGDGRNQRGQTETKEQQKSHEHLPVYEFKPGAWSGPSLTEEMLRDR